MSTKTFCDRCKKEIRGSWYKLSTRNTTLDLCERCNKEFFRWLQEP